MFEIEYKGANCIVISNKKTKLVIDPKLSIVGLKDFPVKDCVEIATEERFAIYNSDESVLINGPGEYGVADFDIRGIAARRHIDSEDKQKLSTMYRIEIDDVRLGVLGNIDENLNDDQLEELGVLDILVLPVGGNGYTLDAVSAAKLVRTIGPKVVIPVHYFDKAIKYEVPQDDLELFVKEIGLEVETVSKYKSKQINNNQAGIALVKIERS
ncbi:MAG: MBL fold metallo-hydrolase [Candidatus Saccharimonadales bacterium]